MEEQYIIRPVGSIESGNGGSRILIRQPFRKGLAGLEGFTHLQIIWWGSLFDSPEAREIMQTEKPYTKGPDVCGIFSTRSPVRPNPVLLSTVQMLHLDPEAGSIDIAWIDAEPGSPVVDIKPYHPSSDRIREARTPQWCSHWPQWYEDSGNFDWEEEFNF